MIDTTFRIPHSNKGSTSRESLTEAATVAMATGRPLTKDELGAYCRCTARFLENEITRGRLRAIRVSPRLVRFRPRDVEAWMEASATTEAAR